MTARGWPWLLGAALLVAAIVVVARTFLADAPPRIGPPSVPLIAPEQAPSKAHDSTPEDAGAPPIDPSAAIDAAPTRTEAAGASGAKGPSVRVHVRDEAGRSLQGIPVALQMLPGRRSSDERGADARARTDAEGLATLVVWSDAWKDPRAVEAARPAVMFEFPTVDARLVAVDLTPPPEQPVELVAPALGRVVVDVVGPDGTPARGLGRVSLSTWPIEHEPEQGVRVARPPEESSVEGRVVLDPIGLGLRVHVLAELAEYAEGSVEGDGPQRAGETATLRLVLPRRGPIVTGRLVLPGGAPAASRQLHGILGDDPDQRARAGDVAVATDASGRFRFDASKYEIEDPHTPRWLDLLEGDASTALRGRARAKLPVPFADGEHDVGDVPFEVAPLVVSGTVVDADGAPVVGAQICLCEPNVAASEWIRAGGSGAVAFARSDERGAFAIRDFVDPTQRLVFATEKRQRESVATRFELGQTDLKLVLRGFGSISGTLTMDRAIDPAHVGVYLRRADAEEASDAFGLRVSPAREGAFHWTRVVAGRVDLAVAIGRYGDEAQPLLVVRDLEVKAGEACADPRLTGIDVASAMKRVRVDLVDADGAPIRDGTVTLLLPGEPRVPFCSATGSGGAFDLPALHDVVDVEATAPGMAVARRFGATAPVRIVLRPGFPVTLALDPPLDPKSASAQVSLRLTLTPDPPRESLGFGQQRVDLAPEGVGLLALAEPGRFRVDLDASCDLASIAGREPTSPRFVEVKTRWLRLRDRLDEAFGAATVEILEDPDEQRIRVPLSADARAVIDEMMRGFRGD